MDKNLLVHLSHFFSQHGEVWCGLLVAIVVVVFWQIYRLRQSLRQRRRTISSWNEGRLQDQIEGLKVELPHRGGEFLMRRERRYLKRQNNIYRIGVIGIPASGKTGLVSKLTNHVFTNSEIPNSTIYQEYDRTISVIHDTEEHLPVRHALRFIEWRGEQSQMLVANMVGIGRDAQPAGQTDGELIHPGLRALIMVVDLGIRAQGEQDIRGSRCPDPHDTLNLERIAEQSESFFHPRFLDILLSENTLTTCSTVVLFINKSDLLAGVPADVEAEARRLFAPLISNIEQRYSQLKVLVGSASAEHSTHKLFAHLVSEVLPDQAYALSRGQLQRLRSEQVIPPLGGSELSIDSGVQLSVDGQGRYARSPKSNPWRVYKSMLDSGTTDKTAVLSRKAAGSIQTRQVVEHRKWNLTLDVDIGNIDEYSLEKILQRLRELSKDAELELNRIELGSVILVLESTIDGFSKIEELFKNGNLAEALGFPIKSLQWQEEEQNMAVQRRRLFYSYAPKDERLRLQLEIHLALLKHEGLIDLWSSSKISPGTNRKVQIEANLRISHIVLFLVSPDFFAVDVYCDEEVEQALRQNTEGTSKVVPILLRPSAWNTSKLAHLQCLPRDGRPITTWKNRDEAWLHIASNIRQVLSDQ